MSHIITSSQGGVLSYSYGVQEGG